MNHACQTCPIADDDFDLAQLLSMRCRQLGLEVFRSPDALHALIGAHRIEPDLALLDVNMPSGNGLSVCEMLSGDRKLANVPVIIVTGSPDAAVRQRCQELGAKVGLQGTAIMGTVGAIDLPGPRS